MTKQKPGRVENPVLEQSARRKRIDTRRKYFQEHRIAIIIATIIAITATMALLLGLYTQ